MSDYCSNISVIPQFGGTCWFNAILMSSFYSQEMRKLMIEHSKTWKDKGSLFKFFKTILKNSYDVREEKNLKLFKKIKPEELLLRILNKYDKKLLKNIVIKKKYGWNSNYISIFLKHMGLKVLDIIDLNNYTVLLNFIDYYNKNIIDNTIKFDKNIIYEEIKNTIINIPDIIIFTGYIKNYSDIYNTLLRINIEYDVFNSKNYGLYLEEIEKILKMEDIIKFNGYRYKLDSVLLSNYNEIINKGHAITGITCNNEHYVYNGWNKETDDPSFRSEGNIKPCSLMKYDWNVNEDREFCLNVKDCKLDEITNREDLCFNFNKGQRTLVYVRIREEDTGEITSSSFKSFSKKSKEELMIEKKKIEIDKYNIEELKTSIQVHNIKVNNKLSIEQLKKILLNILLSKKGLLDISIKREYHTLLPITDFKEEEIIKIGDFYFLKLNLFYHMFIFKNIIRKENYSNILLNKDLLKIDIKNKVNINYKKNNLKELILYFFQQRNIKDIYDNYFNKNLTNINNLIENYFNFINYYTIEDQDILLKFIIKIFGLEFFSSLFFDANLDLVELIELLNKTEISKIIDIISKFNDLNLIPTITTKEELIEYLNNEFKTTGGKKKILKIYKN